jgi:hypothetical protein
MINIVRCLIFKIFNFYLKLLVYWIGFIIDVTNEVQTEVVCLFLTIKPTRCTNFSNLCMEWKYTCFGQFLCPSSWFFHCTHSNGICHAHFLIACKLDYPDPACKLSTNLYDIYQCCVYSEQLLMMDRETVRYMWSFIPRINLRN